MATNHFLFYVALSEGHQRIPIWLKGQFDGNNAPPLHHVLDLLFLGNACLKWHGDAEPPPLDKKSELLAFYLLEAGPPEPVRQVQIDNQFQKQEKFRVGDPCGILTPAEETEPRPPGPELDHYKVYPLSCGKPANAKVELADRWHPNQVATQVGEARYLCVPAEKVHDNKRTGIRDAATHLVLYDVFLEPVDEALRLFDQFVHNQPVRVRLPRFLAVPSHKKWMT